MAGEIMSRKAAKSKKDSLSVQPETEIYCQRPLRFAAARMTVCRENGGTKHFGPTLCKEALERLARRFADDVIRFAASLKDSDDWTV
jgi:hypothetical protein